MMKGASLPFSKGVWRECKYDWRLSRLFKPEAEVQLLCGIKEWQGSTASSGVLSSRHNKKAEQLYDYHNPNKRKFSISKEDL